MNLWLRLFSTSSSGHKFTLTHTNTRTHSQACEHFEKAIYASAGAFYVNSTPGLFVTICHSHTKQTTFILSNVFVSFSFFFYFFFAMSNPLQVKFIFFKSLTSAPYIFLPSALRLPQKKVLGAVVTYFMVLVQLKWSSSADESIKVRGEILKNIFKENNNNNSLEHLEISKNASWSVSANV